MWLSPAILSREGGIDRDLGIGACLGEAIRGLEKNAFAGCDYGVGVVIGGGVQPDLILREGFFAKKKVPQLQHPRRGDEEGKI